MTYCGHSNPGTHELVRLRDAISAYDQEELSENELVDYLGTDIATARTIYQDSKVQLLATARPPVR